MTGEALVNGVRFWEAVCRSLTPAENIFILELPNGTVYSLKNAELREEAGSLHMVTAEDITEQYQKTQMLALRQSRVQALNEELVEYGRRIVSSITAREILNAKVKLHDELGSNLLASKRYILSGGTEADAKAIREALRQNLQYLRRETEPTARDEYEVIMETAEKLNMKIRVTGSLPEEESLRHIIVTGIHECLTNTIRHARGDELTVSLSETDAYLTAVFTNNGIRPEGEIEERGGLATLRSLTERSGGTMLIRSEPRFMLMITLPKEGTFNGL